MTARIVIDASASLAVLLADPEAVRVLPMIDSFLSEPGWAPGHWKLEVANILALKAQQGRMSWAAARELAEVASTWRVDIDADTDALAFGSILKTAFDGGLTTYDAAYLELAVRLGCRLATFDRPLARAARASGVDLVFPDIG